MQGGWKDWNGQAGTKRYRQTGGVLSIVGIMLIGAGLLLLFLCIPGWFWAALAGAVLIVLGWLLLRAGMDGR